MLIGLTLLVASPRIRLFPVNVLFLLVAWFCLWFFSHDLSHHIIGRIFGVGCRYSFLGRSTITRLSLATASNLLRLGPVLGLNVENFGINPASPDQARAADA